MENNQPLPLPNSVATLVLGICSLLFGCIIIGFVLGIIGLAISGGSKRLYFQNPNQYSGYGMLNAGRILSVIGVILGAIALFYYVVVVVIIGAGTLPFLQFLNM
jgi:hypothetical protein